MKLENVLLNTREHTMRGCGWIGEKEKGVSFVELMTVVAIISILAVIAGPAIANWLPNYRLRAAARDMYSNLQRAKLEAIQTHGECAVYFDTVTGKYQIVSGGPDGICNGAPDGNTPVPQNDDVLVNHIGLSHYGSAVRYGNGNATRTVPGSSALPVTVSYANKWIRFNSKGMAREMGYAYLTNSDGTAYAVGTPSFAGAIVLKKWSSSSWE